MNHCSSFNWLICHSNSIKSSKTTIFQDVALYSIYMHVLSITVPIGAPSEVIIESASDKSATFSWNKIPCGLRGGSIQLYTYQLVSNDDVIFTGITANQFTVIKYDEMSNTLPCGLVTFRITGATRVGTGTVFNDIDYYLRSTGKYDTPKWTNPNWEKKKHVKENNTSGFVLSGVP